MNPKKMQAVMKQLGMSQEDIAAVRVIIEQPDDGKIVIENPSVTKMKVQGQEMYQVSGGEVRDELYISEDDIKTVSDKTGVEKDKARQTLVDSKGDLAEAILTLSKLDESE